MKLAARQSLQAPVLSPPAREVWIEITIEILDTDHLSVTSRTGGVD